VTVAVEVLADLRAEEAVDAPVVLVAADLVFRDKVAAARKVVAIATAVLDAMIAADKADAVVVNDSNAVAFNAMNHLAKLLNRCQKFSSH